MGLSVSRVGGAAQTRAMRSVAGRLKLDHAQFRELQAFAQFGTSDLDAATQRQLERGLRANEVLKQPQFAPLNLAEEVAVIFALTNGLLDDVPTDKIDSFESAFTGFLASNKPELAARIESERTLSDELDAELRAAVAECKETVPY